MSPLWLGWLVGVGMAVAGGTTALILFLRWQTFSASLRTAEQLEARPPALAPGPITLRGVVRCDDERPAVVVEIFQKGSHRQGESGWEHTWKEWNREQTLHPFWLDVARQDQPSESVWVVPEQGVILAAELDGVRQLGFDRRARSAALNNGAPASVTGVLARGPVPALVGEGYRDGEGKGWLLKAGQGTMLSSGSLADIGARWSSFYGKSAMAALLVTTVTQVLWYGSFYRLALGGLDGASVDMGTLTLCGVVAVLSTLIYRSAQGRNLRWWDGQAVVDRGNGQLHTPEKLGIPQKVPDPQRARMTWRWSRPLALVWGGIFLAALAVSAMNYTSGGGWSGGLLLLLFGSLHQALSYRLNRTIVEVSPQLLRLSHAPFWRPGRRWDLASLSPQRVEVRREKGAGWSVVLHCAQDQEVVVVSGRPAEQAQLIAGRIGHVLDLEDEDEDEDEDDE